MVLEPFLFHGTDTSVYIVLTDEIVGVPSITGPILCGDDSVESSRTNESIPENSIVFITM
jgi:hypothetical protein